MTTSRQDVQTPATGSTSPRGSARPLRTPGLYAVGLLWLHSEPSSVFAGIGADTAYVVDHLAKNRAALKSPP